MSIWKAPFFFAVLTFIQTHITERNTNPPYSLTFKAKADPGSYWLKADQSMVIPVTGSLWLTKALC